MRYERRPVGEQDLATDSERRTVEHAIVVKPLLAGDGPQCRHRAFQRARHAQALRSVWIGVIKVFGNDGVAVSFRNVHRHGSRLTGVGFYGHLVHGQGRI